MGQCEISAVRNLAGGLCEEERKRERGLQAKGNTNFQINLQQNNTLQQIIKLKHIVDASKNQLIKSQLH